MTPYSPAEAELVRGDVITKIEDYDARDLTHQDAQRLFMQAIDQIKLVIRRDDIVAVRQCITPELSRPGSSVATASPTPDIGFPKGYIYGPLSTY